MNCEQGSTIMSTYRTDCFCAAYPCDQGAPLNGIRFGCPPLEAPRPCEVEAVAERANYLLRRRQHRLQRLPQLLVLSLMRVVITTPIAVRVLPAEMKVLFASGVNVIPKTTTKPV